MKRADVVPLSVAEVHPVPEVVAALEHALEMARSGDLIGVGIVAAHRGRCDGTSFALGESNIATLVLSCERLKLRLLREGE
jgi:hypothetical protein